MGFAPLYDSEVCINTWLQADLTKLHSTVGSQMTRGCCDIFFTIKLRLCFFFTSKCKQKFFVALKEEKGGREELIRSFFYVCSLKIKHNISHFPTQFVCLIRVS